MRHYLLKSIGSIFLSLSLQVRLIFSLKCGVIKCLLLISVFFLSACNNEEDALQISGLKKQMDQVQARLLVLEEGAEISSSITVSVEELVFEVEQKGFYQVLLAKANVVAIGSDLPGLAQVELAYQVVSSHTVENKKFRVSVLLVQGKGSLDLTIDLPIVVDDPASIQLKITPQFWYPVYSANFKK